MWKTLKYILVILLIFMMASCFGVIFYSVGKLPLNEKKIKISDNSILLIKNNKILPDAIYTPKNLFSMMSAKKQITFQDFLNNILNCAYNNKIKAILIKADEVALTRVQFEEFQNTIKEFKKISNKPVYAYLDYIDSRNYLIATVADSIFMPKTAASSFSLTGYYYPMQFLKGLFDKLGIYFEVIHMGKYKGAGENFSRKEMSEYLRENMKMILNDLYEQKVETISKNRKIDFKLLLANIDNGNLAFRNIDENLIKERFIDGFYTLQEIKDMLKKKFNIDDEINFVNPINMFSLPNTFSKNKIAIINAFGEIRLGESGENFSPLSGNETNILGSSSFISDIEKIKNDKDVKALIINVNSPGGSALASELMYQAIQKLKNERKIPVYISMGDVAASGGYYISSAGDKIYAKNSTITGSIGVVSMIANVSNGLNKLGITIDPLERGKYASLGNPFAPIDKDGIQLLQKEMSEIYTEFKAHVSKGRNLSMEKVEEIAQGKVWTGKKAKEVKLVDEIGTLNDAVNDLKKKLNLENVSLDYYPKTKSFIDILMSGEIFDTRFYLPENKLIISGLENNELINNILIQKERAEYYCNKPALIIFEDKMIQY